MATPPKTARKGPRAKAGVSAVQAEQRRLNAWRLADEEGLNCPEIAERLGVTRQAVHQMLQKEMDVREGEVSEHFLRWRTKNTVRHETQLRQLAEIRTRAVSEADLKTQLACVKEARKVVAELSKLWGANAPVKNELSGPNGGPVQTQTLPGIDLSNATDEQLAQMLAILEKIAPPAAGAAGQG